MRDPGQRGFAVRRDWPGGTHEFVGFRSTADRLRAFILRDRAYWRGSPTRPRRWAIVAMRRTDFDRHAARRDCRGQDCPDTPDGTGDRPTSLP